MSSPTNKKNSNRIALSAAVTAALLSGYGSRQAFAGTCVADGITAGTFICSGAISGTDSRVKILTSNPITVTTTDGFGIDTNSTKRW